jgi:hypothetical protein
MTAPKEAHSWQFVRNVVVKALLLFVFINAAYGLWGSDLHLGRLSAYNRFYPGRERFPFGENPQETYNFSLYDVDAMFASHRVTAGEADQNHRVFIVGDSSIWGTLLTPEDTLAGQLNQRGLTVCDFRPVEVFNLGYPTLSLLKDLIIIDQGAALSPDLVIWMVTLESFPAETQFTSPIVENNLLRVKNLELEAQGIGILEDFVYADEAFWERTLVGQRRPLADLVRLQLYGIPWAATGIDQVYPQYEPAQRDLALDDTYYDFAPGLLDRENLSFDLLSFGAKLVVPAEFVIINEPILVSQGENHDIRYNFYYPRWAYDQYRDLLHEEAQAEDWNYIDYWDLVPETEFTNSAIHLTPSGTALLADRLEGIILNTLCQ